MTFTTFVPSLPLSSRFSNDPLSLPQHRTSTSPLPTRSGLSALTMKEKSKPKSQKARPKPRGFSMLETPRFEFTGKLRPGHISERRKVPSSIPHPDYAKSGTPKHRDPKFPWQITALTDAEVEKMRVSCRMAREILDIAARLIRPGILTDEIDEVIHREIVAMGAYPSPLNYNLFPKSCCTSINEVICHGIPDSTALVDGDIINVDVTLYYDGYHGDCSETFLVGNVDTRGRNLVRTTYQALDAAIEICKPGLPVKEIGGVIEDIASSAGLSVVRNFCGHGVNSVFHTTPNVLHFRNNEPAGVLKPNITFTIEPMLNEGSPRSIIWPDQWTATTVDGKRSAQFEHTLLITDDGVERLTAKLETSPKFFWED